MQLNPKSNQISYSLAEIAQIQEKFEEIFRILHKPSERLNSSADIMFAVNDCAKILGFDFKRTQGDKRND